MKYFKLLTGHEPYFVTRLRKILTKELEIPAVIRKTTSSQV